MKPRVLQTLLAAPAAVLLGACASSAPSGYGLAGARAAATQAGEPGVDAQTTYLNLIRQMQQKGLWFASLAHIDALEQQQGITPESLLLRADALRQTSQPEASLQYYRKLMGTPLEAAGYRGQGLLAGAQGDYARAVQMLEQAQRRNPTDPLLLSDLGYAYLKSGHTAQARVPIMQSAQMQPGTPRIQSNLALYLLADGQTEQAQALMAEYAMPADVRAAIVREARLLDPALRLPDVPLASADAGGSALMLKTSERLGPPMLPGTAAAPAASR